MYKLKALFGTEFDLPSMPGTASGIEQELKQFLKEIDNAFMVEQKDLLQQLNEYNKICKVQKEEIDRLRHVLQESENIPEEVKHYFSTYQSNVKNEQLQIQIERLIAENERLKDQLFAQNPLAAGSNFDGRMSTELIALQKEVSVLKRKLEINEEEKRVIKEQCEKLLNLNSELQEYVNEEKNRAEVLEKYPIMQDCTENTIFDAFKKSIERNQIDFQKFENELHYGISSCFENLIRDTPIGQGVV